MGKWLGSKRAETRRRSAYIGLIVGASVLAAACGGGGEDDENPFAAVDESEAETTTTELRPCSEDRHLVVFDIIGMLTLGDYGPIAAWGETGAYPEARPGLAETAQAYRQKGYEILYVTTLPVDSEIYGQPSIDAMAGWLTEKGFPMDAGTRVWAMDTVAAGGGTSWGTISNELLRVAGEGVTIDAGYTENSDKSYGLATGGVPTDRLFTLGSLPVEGVREHPEDTTFPLGPPTSPVANDDFVAHAGEIGDLPPVCQV